MDRIQQFRASSHCHCSARIPLTCAFSALPLLSMFAGSFDLGSSAEGLLKWENSVRWMESVLPLLRDGAMVIVFYWVAVLLPMSIFRRMHPLIAKWLRFSSLLIGGVCWWQSFIVVYRLMGWLPVVTGLLCGGVGVIPMALAVTGAREDWLAFGNLAATAILTILARLIARSIANRGARQKAAVHTRRYYVSE